MDRVIIPQPTTCAPFIEVFHASLVLGMRSFDTFLDFSHSLICGPSWMLHNYFRINQPQLSRVIEQSEKKSVCAGNELLHGSAEKLFKCNLFTTPRLVPRESKSPELFCRWHQQKLRSGAV
jgi:hypothetical protein